MRKKTWIIQHKDGTPLWESASIYDGDIKVLAIPFFTSREAARQFMKKNSEYLKDYKPTKKDLFPC